MKTTGCYICAKPTDLTAKLCRNGHSICSGCAKKVNFCSPCQTHATVVWEAGLSSYTELNVQLYLNSDFEGNNPNLNEPKNWNSRYVQSDGCNITTYFNDHTAVDRTQLVRCENKLFWYKHKTNPIKQMMYWSVQFLGPPAENKMYYYEVMLKPMTASPKPLKAWKVCESGRRTMEETIAQQKCIAMPFKMLRAHSFGDTIQFEVTLCKVRQQRKLPNSLNKKIPASISTRSSPMQLNINWELKVGVGGIQPPNPAAPSTAYLDGYQASPSVRFYDPEQEHFRRAQCHVNKRLENCLVAMSDTLRALSKIPKQLKPHYYKCRK